MHIDSAVTAIRVSHIHWFFLPRNGGGDEFELHGVPLTFKLDESSDVVDEWDVIDVEYCHQVWK